MIHFLAKVGKGNIYDHSEQLLRDLVRVRFQDYEVIFAQRQAGISWLTTHSEKEAFDIHRAQPWRSYCERG